MFGNMAAALGGLGTALRQPTSGTVGSNPSVGAINSSGSMLAGLFGRLGSQGQPQQPAGGMGFLGMGGGAGQNNPASPFFTGGFTAGGSPQPWSGPVQQVGGNPQPWSGPLGGIQFPSGGLAAQHSAASPYGMPMQPMQQPPGMTQPPAAAGVGNMGSMIHPQMIQALMQHPQFQQMIRSMMMGHR